MQFDLDSYDLKTLKDLKKKVDRAIDSHDERQKSKAMEAVRAAAEGHGFKLSDLFGEAPTKKMVPPKYANPDNKEQTWTGRGRAPGWVKMQMEAGKKMEDLEISGQAMAAEGKKQGA